MAEKIPVGTKKKFGPYKGSAANGGRPIYVTKTKTKSGWETTSQNKARADYESANGKIKSKDSTVDHKNNNHSDDRKGNLQLLSKSKNTAKENKRRAGKK